MKGQAAVVAGTQLDAAEKIGAHGRVRRVLGPWLQGSGGCGHREAAGFDDAA